MQHAKYNIIIVDIRLKDESHSIVFAQIKVWGDIGIFMTAVSIQWAAAIIAGTLQKWPASLWLELLVFFLIYLISKYIVFNNIVSYAV